MHKFTVKTDTASLAFFDVESLKHRLSDTADWWDLEEDLIEEMSQGNIGFCSLQSDGSYNVVVSFTPTDEFDSEFNLTLPSGRLFIGPGEEITGAGFDPDNSKYNCGKVIEIEIEIEIETNKITVSVKRLENNVFLHIEGAKDTNEAAL